MAPKVEELLLAKAIADNQSGMSDDLARNIGVSLNTVQRWEMERNEPSPLAREKLMALFREVLDGDQLKLL